MSGLVNMLKGGVLLAYQAVLIGLMHLAVVVYEKSRRVGISWTAACAAVLTAAAQKIAGGMDVLYIGYNLEMAREFIGDCAFWASKLHGLAVEAQECMFDEGDPEKAVKAFRIRFSSGFEIMALSSRPRSLRGKQGFVIIDEAAFHDDLAGLIKAAMALLIWGGRVWIISTHDGEDNPFNELVQECREKKLPYKVLRTTFEEAVKDGLYKRVCLVAGKEWTEEGEAEWVKEIRANYKDDVEEELDCIPSKSKGVWLTRALIESCMDETIPVLRLTCEPGFELKPEAERQSFVDEWLRRNVDPLLQAMNPRWSTWLGEDFGRSGDLSVVVPLQETSDLRLRAPFVLELRNVPFRQQEQIFFHVVDRLPRFSGACMDARGNGQFLAEYAMQRYGEYLIEQVMLSPGWYLENMPPVKAGFEDRTFQIPRDPDIRNDLRLVEVERGIPRIPEGKRHKGADGGQRHGDFAVALAMAKCASRKERVEYGYESIRTRTTLDGRPAEDDDDKIGLFDAGAF